jgi:hypothetical protein
MPLIQQFSSCCEPLLHLVDDITMVKNGCSRIDFGCIYVVVLQPRLCSLHLVVPIATFVLCCIKFHKRCKR